MRVEDFYICDISTDLKDILKKIERRKNYIYKYIKKSKIIENYNDILNKKDKNMNQNKYGPFKNILNEVLNYGSILNNDNLIKQFNNFIKEPIININFSDLSEKKNIINFGKEITNIIVFNKNKIIVSFYNEQIKFYSFDRKTFREETTFKPLEADNLKNIKNIDKVSCMKELIDGTLLLGSIYGYIIHLKINEIQKKNKCDINAQLLNQVELENSSEIKKLIEINTNTFISSDEDKNNIILQEYENKKELKKGEIYKVNNYLIILDDFILLFLDIKENFEEIGKIEINLLNLTILNDKYLIGEDSRFYIYHLISIEDKKEVQKLKFEPETNIILKKIGDKLAFDVVEKNNMIKLIKIELINNNNDIDLISDNKETLIIESDSHITNIFNEFFIVSNDGNISCYGCF